LPSDKPLSHGSDTLSAFSDLGRSGERVLLIVAGSQSRLIQSGVCN